MADPAARFTILIVDDSEDILALLELTLRKEYHVKRAADGRTALRVAFEKPRPDLILLDVEMPGTSGYDVCRAIKASPALADVPVIFLTQRNEAQDVVQGFQLGAIDYFAKPINPPVLAARIHAHVELITRRGQQDELIRVRTTQLEQTRLQLIRRLGRAMEYHETSAVGNRVVRLGHYARHLAEAAGARPVICDLIMKAAPLHDIGKLGVPAQILRKTEKLTAPEREQMQRHPEIGAEIIGDHDDPLLKLARTLALTHHERWDGTGYPAGLRGNAIPWPGRVMAIVDAFEGMTATQFHREPLPVNLAVDEIVRGSGKQFDPQMVEAFRKALPAYRSVKETYADSLGDMLDLDFVAAHPPAAFSGQRAPGAAVVASVGEEREALEARAVQGMRDADASRARALAGAQARLKVERDLTAMAAKDVSTQQAARKRAEESGARDAELLGLSMNRSSEEAAAARAAEERTKAEEQAASLAQQAAHAKAQELVEAGARLKAEETLAAAAEERRKAEEVLARTVAELAATEARTAQMAMQRAADEGAAKRAAEERARTEAALAARAGRETTWRLPRTPAPVAVATDEQDKALGDAKARADAEQAAAKAAVETAAAEQQKAAAAIQRAADAAAAKAAIEKRLDAEADAAKAVTETETATAQALVAEKAIAEMQVRLKVERDLTAAATRDLATQRSARALAQDLASRETEALEAAKRRLVEEGAATRVAQERAKAEENAAKLAQQVAHAKAEVLVEAEARSKAEQALAAAAAEKRKAEEAVAKTTADTAAAEQRTAAAAKQRAVDQAAAKAAAESRLKAEAEGAKAVQETEVARATALVDEKALADLQVRLKVERDMAAAALKSAAMQQAARKRAEEAAVHEAELLEVSKKRVADEAAAAHAAQERADAEAKLAGAAKELEHSKANALAQTQARIKSEQALAAATQEKLRAEESARRKAEEVVAAEAKAMELAKKRAETEAQVSNAARSRKGVEATATKVAGERVELEAAQRARAREWAGSGTNPAAPPRRYTTPLTPVYVAILVAVAVAAVAFYGELQTLPSPLKAQAVSPPTPISAPSQRPIAGLSEGAPLALRLDIDFEKLAPREPAK